jgi:serine/threonine-protein kinase
MAVVYLARDLKHDRPVALKVLLPELAASLGADRFQREIRLAARLQHPHILTVHDSGQMGGRLWFTMPYVEGESLRDRLRREKQLPLDEALRITREAAQALQYAHDQGVIHRDIKPENLLLTRDGSTLVADFGIARAVEGDDHLTRTGSSMGTPAYMSPEQADGKPADGRTDVYSLGCVLYEMLVGRPPYTGSTAVAIVTKWFTEPVPSARAARPEVPEPVDQAIQRALSRSADDRFTTTAEFVRALQGTPSGFTPAPTAATTAPAATGHRRLLAAVVALGLVVLIAVQYFRRSTGTPAGETPKVLAVLPFENLGDSADAYFADGIANELRAKLSHLGGVQVIARASSNQYRGTTKPPEEIARELGANYLLTATVQWDRVSGGRSRVRVSPELVEVTASHAPRAAWQQPFAAALTDVFDVQADIAAQVAGALGAVLGDSARLGLTRRPTESLAAYDEFLKGEAAAQEMKAENAGLRRAIGFYERAVALDGAYAQAWSQLSRARTQLYSNGVPDRALAEAARAAAERARELRPDEPLAYLAAGELYSSVNPIDNVRALEEYEHGLRLAPGDVDLLSVSAIAEALLGRWDSVAPRLERARLRDPRSFTVARRLATTRIFLRQYPAADSALDQAIALAPTNAQVVLLKVILAVARGDRAAADAATRAAAARIDAATLLPFLATYQDLFWVLDDAQQRQVLALPPSAFDDDRGIWGLVRAQLYHLRGDSVRSVAYADSARVVLAAQSRAAPDDAQRHAILGVALAYLGRKAEAIREGRRGAELLPIDRDGYNGPYVQLQLVRIYALTGEPGPALDALEPLLKVPFYLSPGWLRLDPAFDPLRKEPRFQRLANP